jgi:DNA recombination protein RmuC
VALLKAVAFGFKQEAVAQNIEEVRRLSQELIDRITKVGDHFDKLGRHLKQATDSYNQTLSSLDSRVMVTARKLADIKSLSSEHKQPPNLAFVDIIPKPVTFGSSERGDNGE